MDFTECLRRCAETGARYKLLIDLHGTFKPTGLQRTYPNTINFEGVHGLEEMKWAQPGTDQVTYDVMQGKAKKLAGKLLKEHFPEIRRKTDVKEKEHVKKNKGIKI